jgi:hypothetical protein
MKGEVFVGFVELVERRFGEDVADMILSDPSLASGGAYSRVATYDHAEMVHLVVALSRITGSDPAALQQAFGAYLFGRLVAWHADFVAPYKDCFGLLETIEGTIHVNVKKLYPDAMLPSIRVTRLDEVSLELSYRSERGFAHVCHGLIEGCVAHFDEGITVTRLDASEGPLDQSARFRLERRYG